MLKKLLKLTKFVVTGIIWIYIYAGLASFITIYFWKFNLLSARSWNIIAVYWHSGNAITSQADFLFLLSLLVIFIIWLAGLIYLSRQDYVKVFLFPIILYNGFIIRKYGQDSPRIVLKNLGFMQKLDLSQLVEQKLAKEKGKKREKIDIRSGIKNKIESAKK